MKKILLSILEHFATNPAIDKEVMEIVIEKITTSTSITKEQIKASLLELQTLINTAVEDLPE